MKSRYKSIRITEIWLWIISSTDPTLRLNPFSNWRLPTTGFCLAKKKKEKEEEEKKKMPQENKS